MPGQGRGERRRRAGDSVAADLRNKDMFWRRDQANMGAIVNSAEHHRNMDMVIKEELGNMHVGVPGFYNRFFGCVAGLEEASEIRYKKCTEGSSPRFSKGGGLEWMAARTE